MSADDTRGMPDERRLIDAYLLDGLAEADRSAFEDRFFADDAFADLVLDREHDLVDALAGGTLPADQTRALMARLAKTPEGENRLRTARALQAWQRSRPAAGAAPTRVGRRATAWWQAGAAAALAAGIAWLTVDDLRLRDAIRQAERPAPTQPPPTGVEPPMPAARGTVRVVLDPVRTRGRDSVLTIDMPAEARAVHLVLPGIDVSRRYEARVETSPGAVVVAELSNLGPSAEGALDLWLGVGQLPDGDYDVLLSSTGRPDSGLVGQYAFRVRRGVTSSP